MRQMRIVFIENGYKFLSMHLIKNKSQTILQSSSSLQIQNASKKSLSKNHAPKSSARPQTQRIHLQKKIKTVKIQKQTGLVARALSGAKSTISKLMFLSQKVTNNKLHVIGSKYVYSEDDIIGKGYSSHVYKGSHIDNQQNKNFAIKVLDLVKIKGFLLDLLKKEIAIHRNLDHPNIVKCFDVIQTENYIYIVQEYCSGGDLGTYITQRKCKITEGQALNIMSQITQGYKYLIQQTILHRDLKPCNIFRCKMNEKWKIGDFGFSCLSSEEPDDINVGTPIYMPPQSLQKSFYSHKSDFFSLGIIMYQIIYGKVPWFSKSQSLLIKKMRQNGISFDGEKQSLNSPLIKRFIERCCQVDYDARMSEDQFLKLELYPRRPEQTRLSKRNSKSRIKPQEEKQQIEKLVDTKSYTINDIKVQKNPSMTNLQVKNPLNGNKTIQVQTQRKKSDSYAADKISKTSQYSTEAQTRAISDFSSPASDQTYKSNSEILLQQNSFCKHLYYMLKNMDSFLLSEGNKELLNMVMYRHILYLLKKLKNSKFNYFQLKKWQAYKLSKQYASFHKEVVINFQRVENEYFRFPKRKDIKLMRQINSKFKELDHEVEFNMKFYVKITNWLKELISDFKHQISNHLKQSQVILFKPQKKYNSKLKTEHSSNSKIQSQVLSPSKLTKMHNTVFSNKNLKLATTPQPTKDSQSLQKKMMNTGQKIKAKISQKNVMPINHQPQLTNHCLSSSKSKDNQDNQLLIVKNDNKHQAGSLQVVKQGNFDPIQIKKVQIDKQLQINLQKYLQKEVVQTKDLAGGQSPQVEDTAQITTQWKTKEQPLSPSNISILKLNQNQSLQSELYDKLPYATLQALLSLLQYHHSMESKITGNKDAHSSYSLIDLHQNCQEENNFSLVRQYNSAKFKSQDIVKIKYLASFF